MHDSQFAPSAPHASTAVPAKHSAPDQQPVQHAPSGVRRVPFLPLSLRQTEHPAIGARTQPLSGVAVTVSQGVFGAQMTPASDGGVGHSLFRQAATNARATRQTIDRFIFVSFGLGSGPRMPAHERAERRPGPDGGSTWMAKLSPNGRRGFC